MKKFLIPFLIATTAFGTMSATLTGLLPNSIWATGAIPFNYPVTLQYTIGNTSGGSVNIISAKPFALESGDTGGGSLTAKAISFGQPCLTGVGGVTGSCNNIAPGTSQTNGASLVLNIPAVFFGPSSFPPWVQYAPALQEFGALGAPGSSLTFGFGGASVAALTGTYKVDAIFQGNDGSYFNTGGSTFNVTAILLPGGK